HRRRHRQPLVHVRLALWTGAAVRTRGLGDRNRRRPRPRRNRTRPPNRPPGTATGRRRGGPVEMTEDTTMRTRVERTTRELMDGASRLALVLAEIGGPDLFRAVKRHPERALNVGIREQLMIGVAAGFSLAGYRPIVHTYAPFLVERPFEQVKLDL